MIHFFSDPVFMKHLKEEIAKHDETLLREALNEPQVWSVRQVWKDVTFRWEWFEGNFAALYNAIEMVCGTSEAQKFHDLLTEEMVRMMKAPRRVSRIRNRPRLQQVYRMSKCDVCGGVLGVTESAPGFRTCENCL